MRLFATAFAALLLLLVACGGGGDDAPPRAISTSKPVPATQASASGRLSIPSLGISAPISLKELVNDAPPPSPDGAKDVALYDFGPRLRGLGGAPGEGGNAVMVGRSLSDVGCAPAEPPCNGVFISLGRIALGDRIDVTWRGGEHRYQVVSVCTVATQQFGMGLYNRTPDESLTLLTGTGQLGPNGFTHLLIVIAKRAPVTAAQDCPGGTKTGPAP
jgi:LPXTG-site transpeptidase (sortase) family protein